MSCGGSKPIGGICGRAPQPVQDTIPEDGLAAAALLQFGEASIDMFAGATDSLAAAIARVADENETTFAVGARAVRAILVFAR